MSINLEQIKELREKTAVSIAECKAALEQTSGDIEKAIIVLRKRGLETANRKSQRETKEGIIAFYVHTNKKVGALLELFCETDFVAKNADFEALGKDLAMQVVAANPKAVKPEDISQEEMEQEENIYREQLEKSGKPAEIVEKALQGKISKFREENALLTQPFIKDPGRKVDDVIKETISKVGENIQVGRFCRFQI
ncbi:MAG: elongation factor Ts [Candidatus Moranbacteria bacterium]|nr:elongation factor Ts [Candidatus Moranbacteria bacterium]